LEGKFDGAGTTSSYFINFPTTRVQARVKIVSN
jgi:hypothetical protein